MLNLIVAAAFVALWSTGFIVARAIKPYADPNLFLLARFAGTALLFGAFALAARATSLLFLAPPLAAVQGYLLFGETLTPLQIAGFGVALAGVTLARR